MSKKYNRDSFETNNTSNDLHGRGANQQEDVAQSSATKHYDRDAFETNNTGNDLHGRGANQQEDVAQSNATNITIEMHLKRTTLVMIYMVEVRINKKT